MQNRDDVTTSNGSGVSVTVWSDFLCPWCYLNQRRVERLRDVHSIDVTWMPYELHPNVPAEGRLLADAYGKGDPVRANHALQKFVDIAAEEAMPFSPPTRVYPTRKAHLLASFVAAEHPDHHEALHRALFAAVWVNDLDITDADVLADIAATCGIDRGAALTAVTEETALDAVAASREEAIENSVVGVPSTMFSSGFVLPGLQDEMAIDRIAERLIARAAAEGEAADG